MKQTHTPVRIRGSQQFNMFSASVSYDFQINLRLPKSYEDSQNAYPLLLILDSDDAFPLVVNTVELLEAEGRLPELIVVGAGYGVDSSQVGKGNFRMRDYFPGIKPDFEGSGGIDRFINFIADELFPYIERNFRVNPLERCIIGVSAGGLFGLYALFTHTTLFNRYLISSPAIKWDRWDTCPLEAEFASTHSSLPVHLYLSVGTEDLPGFEQDLQDFHQVLENRQYAGLSMDMAIEFGGHLSSQPGAVTKGLMALFADLAPKE